jgi:dTDP-L-rhamnose 4-epimerase
VFGSRQALSNPYTGVAAIFLSRLKNGRSPIIFEDGGQSRDFIHVHDVARAVLHCVELDGCASGAYNICTGKPITIGQVADVLAGLLRVELELEAVGRYRAGDIRHCFGNPARAADTLGFTATCSFEDGMRELIRWAAEVDAEDRVDASLEELQRQGLVRHPVR